MDDYIIRNEVPADYGEAENLTREAFWNVYRPGCDEHYLPAPEGDEAAYFMIKELVSGFLAGVKGSFEEPDGYLSSPEEVARFDAQFKPKEKKRLPD